MFNVTRSLPRRFAAPGVAGLNITVTEIDVQTVGMEVTVMGDHLEVSALVRAI